MIIDKFWRWLRRESVRNQRRESGVSRSPRGVSAQPCVSAFLCFRAALGVSLVAMGVLLLLSIPDGGVGRSLGAVLRPTCAAAVV